MGGYGSTRWNWHTKKTTVEECRQITVSDFLREGLLESDIRRSGVWAWWNAHSGERTASMGYEVNTTDQLWLRLHYTITDWQKDKKDYDYKIQLQTTHPHFGGLRWWFTCPLVINNRPCLRRIAKLYLPPGGRYYGCRKCNRLTYKSCQESDKRMSALRRLGPLGILEGMNSGDVDLLLGLKALPEWVWKRGR